MMESWEKSKWQRLNDISGWLCLSAGECRRTHITSNHECYDDINGQHQPEDKTIVR